MLSNPSDFRNAEAPGGVSLSSHASIAAKPGDARFVKIANNARILQMALRYDF